MSKPLASHIASSIPAELREEALSIPVDELPAWCERQLEIKKSTHYRKPGIKRFLPPCGYPMVRGRGPCTRKPLRIDKKVVDGRCRAHTGLKLPPSES